MFKRVFAATFLVAMTMPAQATPIRIELETNVTTAIDFITKATISVTPISGKFALEFDDANAVWDRDEWGPYFTFSTDWITTPVTSHIPFSYFDVAPGAQQYVYTETFGSGVYGDTGTVPVKGYGDGYNDQGFGFQQTVAKVGLGPAGRESNRYTLSIGFQRISPVETFKPLSTLEFLQTFVGEDKAGGTAILAEGYRLQHYIGSMPTYYEGLTYLDRNLKVTAVIDKSAEVPEPGTIALMLSGLVAAGALRRRRAVSSAYAC